MITYFSFVLISLLIVSFIKKIKFKGIDIRLLGLLPFVLLFLFAQHTPDLENYKLAYYKTYIPFQERGMVIVSEILSNLGLSDFFYFQILVIFLVFYTFRLWGKVIKNIYYVIFLYSLFIMYYDVVQIRNTVAMMLILSAVFHSIEKKYLFSILFAFASMLFHKLAILPCIILLCVSLIKPQFNYSIKKLEICMLATLTIFSIFLSKFIIIFFAKNIPFFIKLNSYITSDVSVDSLMIWGGYELFLIIALFYLGYSKFIHAPYIEEWKKDFSSSVLRFMLYGISISGILLFLDEIHRIYRLFFLVGYLLYGLVENHLSRKNRFFLFTSIASTNIVFMLVSRLRGFNFDVYW